MLSKPIFRLFFILLLFPVLLTAEPLDWPRDLETESGTFKVYQPQMESLEGSIMKYRSAMSYVASGKDTPVFGVAWMESKVEVDRDERSVDLLDIKVVDTRFPESEGVDYAADLNKSLETRLADTDMTLSLDQVLASLEAVSDERAAAEVLKMDPPEIIYRDKPAILVVLDGEPVIRDIEESQFQAIINTEYPLIIDSKAKTYYLNPAQDVWYRAEDVMGPWTLDEKTPKDISSLVEMDADEVAAEEESTEKVTTKNAPEIIVVTRPAELIVSDGKPDFTPLVDDLLVMTNTDSPVFMDVVSQNYFVVMSGRWYKSDTMEGPWEHVSSDTLPDSFREIPKDSDSADVLAYVAGTLEAREAVLDAQIPQTASVKRGVVDLDVEYDGEPEFEKIDETSLYRAVNTGDQIIWDGDDYYLVRDAVWYQSTTPEGPWEVADKIPADVAKIPASSPVYNVKYVKIYDTTPDVVYVGYTPGYVGSYVYGPTIVYGTGWYYRPWISPYRYYPYQSTWGFHVTYNPWTGWGFGLSYNWGPFRVGFHSGGYWHRHHSWHHHHHHYSGRYGRGGYHKGHRPKHRDDYRKGDRKNRPGNKGPSRNIYKRDGQRANVVKSRERDRVTPVKRDKATTGKLRDREKPVTRDKAGTGKVDRDSLRKKADKANNVYADKDGNVFRKTDKGWEKRDKGGWDKVTDHAGDKKQRPSTSDRKPVSKPATKPATRPADKPRPAQKPASRPVEKPKPAQKPASKPVQKPKQAQRPAPRQTSPKRRDSSSLDRQHNSRQRGNNNTRNFQQSRSSGGHRQQRGGGR